MEAMRYDEPVPGSETTKRQRPRRTWLYGILLLFVLWLLIANHIILVPDDPALVILNKTSWNFDSSVIGESSWTAFTLHHPILMTRLATGEGFWIIGGSP
jgi:hypothetical protein